MSSLNLDLDYFVHPKTRRLVGLLGRDTEVLPLRLWCYCGKFHARDGRLMGYTAQEIESLVEWRGSPGKFVKSMITVGFLIPEKDGYRVHDWEEHQGHLYSYMIRGKKAAKARWERVNGACNKHATSNARDGPLQCHSVSNSNTISQREKFIEQTRKKLKGGNGHAAG